MHLCTTLLLWENGWNNLAARKLSQVFLPFITICQINEYPACPTPTPYSAEDKDYLHIEIEMGGGRGCLVDETGKPDNMLSIYSLITSSLITRTKKD